MGWQSQMGKFSSGEGPASPGERHPDYFRDGTGYVSSGNETNASIYPLDDVRAELLNGLFSRRGVLRGI